MTIDVLNPPAAFTEHLDDAPDRHSGDERNPHPGPLVAPWAIWERAGFVCQVTFSPPSAGEVRVIALMLYEAQP